MGRGRLLKVSHEKLAMRCAQRVLCPSLCPAPCLLRIPDMKGFKISAFSFLWRSSWARKSGSSKTDVSRFLSPKNFEQGSHQFRRGINPEWQYFISHKSPLFCNQREGSAVLIFFGFLASLVVRRVLSPPFTIMNKKVTNGHQAGVPPQVCRFESAPGS